MIKKDESIPLKRRFRLLNFVVDGIAIYFLWWGLGSVAFLFFEEILGFDFSNASRRIYEEGNSGLVYDTILLSSFVVTLFLYYVPLEYYFQKTLGKVVTHSKVVTITGEKATFKQIVKRTACRFIPMKWITFMYSRSALHDVLSDTEVVGD